MIPIITGVIIGFVFIAVVIANSLILVKHKRSHPSNSIPLISIKLAKNIENIEIKERFGRGQFGDIYKGIWQIVSLEISESVYTIFQTTENN